MLFNEITKGMLFYYVYIFIIHNPVCTFYIVVFVVAFLMELVYIHIKQQ